MKTKWQKARIEKESFAPFAHLVGKEIWVIADPDLVQDIGNIGELIVVSSNLQLSPLEPTKGFGCFLGSITLLYRGPEDFAEDVPMIPSAVWGNPAWLGCGSYNEIVMVGILAGIGFRYLVWFLWNRGAENENTTSTEQLPFRLSSRQQSCHSSRKLQGGATVVSRVAPDDSDHFLFRLFLVKAKQVFFF